MIWNRRPSSKGLHKTNENNKYFFHWALMIRGREWCNLRDECVVIRDGAPSDAWAFAIFSFSLYAHLNQLSKFLPMPSVGMLFELDLRSVSSLASVSHITPMWIQKKNAPPSPHLEKEGHWPLLLFPSPSPMRVNKSSITDASFTFNHLLLNCHREHDHR